MENDTLLNSSPWLSQSHNERPGVVSIDQVSLSGIVNASEYLASVPHPSHIYR